MEVHGLLVKVHGLLVKVHGLGSLCATSLLLELHGLLVENPSTEKPTLQGTLPVLKLKCKMGRLLHLINCYDEVWFSYCSWYWVYSKGESLINNRKRSNFYFQV